MRKGRVNILAEKDFKMSPVDDNWTSAQTKASYPVKWKVAVPKLGLEFEVTTPLRNQELVSRYGPSYWEGSIDMSGKRGSANLKGVGYLEMTGYAKPGEAVIPR